MLLDKLQDRSKTMLDKNALRGIIAAEGLSQRKVAAGLGITPDTFYRKMKAGVFGSDEIEKMIIMLHIQDPVAIFFANVVN